MAEEPRYAYAVYYPGGSHAAELHRAVVEKQTKQGYWLRREDGPRSPGLGFDCRRVHKTIHETPELAIAAYLKRLNDDIDDMTKERDAVLTLQQGGQ